MFSVNNFYDYLTAEYGWQSKSERKNIFYKFNYPGCRDLFSLDPTTQNLPYDSYKDSYSILKLFGSCYLLDDESINFEYLYFSDNAIPSTLKRVNFNAQYLSKPEQIANWLSRSYSPIICHSEKNSSEINFFLSKNFLEVYYWYHGLIARDWFRHWKFYKFKSRKNSKRFGIYARDITGSRKYRLDILNNLAVINNDLFFEFQPDLLKQLSNDPILNYWPASKKIYDATESARINLEDSEKFQIHLVAETIFDTQKIHLTEKIFKPIVMNQPFILFSSPKSLKYLKDYGFKTFDSLWSEEYDNIENAHDRLEHITNLIKYLQKLPANKFNKLIEKSIPIAEYNRKYFFSEKFEELLVNELWNNFDLSLLKQQEMYYNDPGGNWFQQLDTLYSKALSLGPHKEPVIDALKQLKINDINSFEKIIKKYNHLF